MLRFTGYFVRDEDVKVTQTPIEKIGAQKNAHEWRRGLLG